MDDDELCGAKHVRRADSARFLFVLGREEKTVFSFAGISGCSLQLFWAGLDKRQLVHASICRADRPTD